MAKARVSAGQVKELIETKLDEDVILASMIDTANTYIDAHLDAAGHSNAILLKIELYLSAHFVAITEERGSLKFSKLGESSEAYNTTELGAGLNSTRFGQTALLLDTSGILANISASKLKAEFRVV